MSASANSDRVDFTAVKAASLRSLDFVVSRLLPAGKQEGDEWVARNPTRSDGKPGSFKINMTTGVWSDFATGESGGDMIDLVQYLTGKSNLEAARQLADMLGVAGGGNSRGSSKPASGTTNKAHKAGAAAPADSRVPPPEFPPRTPPNKDGKPAFIVAGDEGPRPRSDELRRHVYSQGGVAVRIKIIKKDKGGAINCYRVVDASGVTGWQFAKPEGFKPVPYFVAGMDPAEAAINQPIFWPEGEKDVDTVARLGGFAFTFGGVGDGLPDGCQQYVVGRPVVILADNDEQGRNHAEAKAAVAFPVATSVKVIHFRELGEKQDVSDWVAIQGNTFVELMARIEKAETWKPPAQTTRGIKPGDFQAYLPSHQYIYVPTRDLWPAVAVNSQLPPMRIIGEDGKPAAIPANVWLDKHQAVEQMTWAPGLPMLIKDQLISEGGWFDHPGAGCFNLYRPPTIKRGDEMKAGRWLDHVKKVYPDDWLHIVMWLACRVQHSEIKINHNLVLSGHPGVGKDTLLQPAMQAVGPWNCTEVSPEELFGNFNGYLKAVILRISEARDMGEVNKFQLYERMKTMSAAPPDVIRVNQKYMGEHHIVNIVGNIITSNYKTEGLYLPADDRRHYVAWSDLKQSDFESKPGAGDASLYFDSMYRWYEQEGGYGHVAAFLATLDISGFNPKAPPPKTPAFWAIVGANRPTEESEIMDALDALNNPDAITIDWLITTASPGLATFLLERKNRKAASHRIADAGYEQVRNDLAKDGLWVIKKARKAIYAKSTLTLQERMSAAKQFAERGL